MADVVFDEEAAKALEAVYGTRDVLRRRAIVRAALGARPGERIVDVGCGPGFYVRELLDEVGPAGAVLGVDASDAMVAAAAHRSEGHVNASFAAGDATSLPAGDGEFDGAISVQVLEYVPDVAAALAELRRVLRPGGRAVLSDVDWATLSWHSTEPERMRRALDAFDRHVSHPALPQRLTAALTEAGFEDVAMDGHAFATNRLDPESYLGALLPLLVGFVAAQEEFGPEEARAWEQEQRDSDARGEFYGSVTQLCFTARRA